MFLFNDVFAIFFFINLQFPRRRWTQHRAIHPHINWNVFMKRADKAEMKRHWRWTLWEVMPVIFFLYFFLASTRHTRQTKSSTHFCACRVVCFSFSSKLRAVVSGGRQLCGLVCMYLCGLYIMNSPWYLIIWMASQIIHACHMF